jgi:Carboxypeptidase regulatory-like domain
MKGVSIVTGKKLIGIGVVLLLLAGAMAWRVMTPRGSGTEKPARGAFQIVEEPEKTTIPDEVAPLDLPAPVDLAKADRDLDLFGRVVDAEGEPVPGADVSAVEHPWQRSRILCIERGDETLAGPTTSTARDGTFSLRLSRGRKVELRVFHEKAGACRIEDCQAGEMVTAILHPAGELLVRAVDESGAPVPAVRVEVSRLWPGEPDFGRSRIAMTDGKGLALFRRLPPGPVIVAAQHERLRPSFVKPSGEPNMQRTTVPIGGRIECDLFLCVGETFRGSVIDAGTGAPIADARVGDSWVLTRATRTGIDGRFALSGARKSTPKLHAVAAGYAKGEAIVPVDGETVIRLHRGDEVFGRVVDFRGSPVAGARLTAMATRGVFRGPTRALDIRSTQSGVDGRFRIANLRRDVGPHTLVVEAIGLAKRMLVFEHDRAEPGAIPLGDVTLAAPRAIEGHVLGADGRGIPNVPIRLLRTDQTVLETGMGGQEDRRTDDLGRFRFPDLAAGRYRVSGYLRSTDLPAVDVDLPEDRNLRDLVIRAAGGEITVLVVDEAGAPVQEALVRIGDRGYPPDESGRVSVAGLPATEITIQIARIVSETLYVPAQELTVVPAGQEVTVRLPTLVAITGRALAPDGSPLPDVVVRATGGFGFEVPVRQSAYSGKKGEFRFKALAGRTVEIAVDGQRRNADDPAKTIWVPVRGHLSDTAPRDDIILRTEAVAADRTLRVTVEDPSGRSLPGAEVVGSARGQTFRMHANEAGVASLTGLPDASIRLWCHRGRARGLTALVIGPESLGVVPCGQTVLLRFRPGIPMTGRVIDAEGRPMSGAKVEARTEDGYLLNTTTDADGRFRTAGISGAIHTIEVNHVDKDGSRSWARVEEVCPDYGETTIRLRSVPR